MMYIFVLLNNFSQFFFWQFRNRVTMCAENECCRRVSVDGIMSYDEIKLAVVEAEASSDRLTKNDDRLCVPRRGV